MCVRAKCAQHPVKTQPCIAYVLYRYLLMPYSILQIKLSDEQMKVLKGVTQKLDQLQKLQDVFGGERKEADKPKVSVRNMWYEELKFLVVVHVEKINKTKK